MPVDKRPTEEEPQGWRLVVSPATDVEGWQYGSVFKCVPSQPPRSLQQRLQSLHRETTSFVLHPE